MQDEGVEYHCCRGALIYLGVVTAYYGYYVFM